MASRSTLSAARALSPHLRQRAAAAVASVARSSPLLRRSLAVAAGPSRNRLATATAPLDRFPSIPPVSTRKQDDDGDVRHLFDTNYIPTSASPTGLFTLGPLTNPRNMQALTERTLVHAQAIVDRISRARDDPSGKELRLVVKNLDRLSDLLCGVIDMCELVRNTHPEDRWVAEADRAYERLCSFMNGLNTDRGLFEALVATLEAKHEPPHSHAETQVALTFLRDFEKSGIDLPAGPRARFVQLSDSILSLGRTFLSTASSGPPQQPLIEIDQPDRLQDGLGANFVRSLPQRRGKALVVPGSWEAQMIVRFARDAELRQQAYIANNQSDPERVEVLEQLLAQRAELAGVLGKSNWAEVALVDKMAKNPENVWEFLSSLAEHHKPQAAADVATLQRLKAQSITGIAFPEELGTAHLPPLSAWDRDYFSERYVSSLAPASLSPLAPYLSTGTVLRGLSRLFSRLYGISFRPAAVAPGEVWHPSVRRLDVVDENEGTIGVIYFDLFSRDGKPPNAAHYTVRCSRRVDDDDLAGDGLPQGWDSRWGPGLETEGETMNGREGRFQLPIVVLTTDFGVVEADRPALLGWHEVETLFHEMGHAMHSMIGRTEYHNVSGTRCATDFVELPSILMEHFVASPSVLGLFAEHYQTGEPLPVQLLQSHLSLQQSFAALETHGQIIMAMLDQRYHSLLPGDAVDSSAVHAALQTSAGVFAPVDGTAWQTQFGHLFGYGATYYSYLFDRAIAGKVFESLFANDPLSRDSGHLLKEGLLKWGGGRDPWEMVGQVVGGTEGEIIARGDEKAMEVVGGWTIK